MTYRIPYSEKGKGIATSSHLPRESRVKVPHFDTAELIRKHSLTIIGRTTSPKQRIWSLIPFLADLWKTSTRAIGADLGQGVFQFQLASEEDMQLILENRAYHFAKWMVILQRWEPSVDQNFPSQIPFWVRVQGIPKHLWSEETFKSIGDDIGLYEKQEITDSSARMRVQVNGLIPLVMSSIVEFENGVEVTAKLVYEKLEKHCSICYMINHEQQDCKLSSNLGTDAKEANSTQRKSYQYDRRMESIIIKERKEHSTTNPSRRLTHHDNRSALVSSHRSPSFHSHYSSHGGFNRDTRHHEKHHKYHEGHKSFQKEGYGRHTSYLSQSFSGLPGRRQSGSQSAQIWREKPRPINKSKSPPIFREEVSESSKAKRPPLERMENHVISSDTLPQQAMLEAMGELRDVMVQYATCADPTESAARRERLRQAEEVGDFEQTAAQMVRSSLELQNQNQDRALEVEQTQTSQERVPVAFRLGPSTVLNKTARSDHEQAPSKKKQGRPPGKKSSKVSPKVLMGANSRKRKSIQARASPRRKLNMDTSNQNLQTNIATDEASGSRKAPQMKLVPAISKKMMGFQDPSLPLP